MFAALFEGRSKHAQPIWKGNIMSKKEYLAEDLEDREDFSRLECCRNCGSEDIKYISQNLPINGKYYKCLRCGTEGVHWYSLSFYSNEKQ